MASFRELYGKVHDEVPSMFARTLASGVAHHCEQAGQLKMLVNQLSTLALVPPTENWGWDWLQSDLESLLMRLAKGRFDRFMDAVVVLVSELGSGFAEFVNDAAVEYQFDWHLEHHRGYLWEWSQGSDEVEAEGDGEQDEIDEQEPPTSEGKVAGAGGRASQSTPIARPLQIRSASARPETRGLQAQPEDLEPENPDSIGEMPDVHGMQAAHGVGPQGGVTVGPEAPYEQALPIPKAALNEDLMKKDVAIIVALAEEFRQFRSLLASRGVTTTYSRESRHGHTYYSLAFGRRPDGSPYHAVAVMIGRMGKTDATLFTERLIERHSPDCVVSIGIAAAQKMDLAIGDVAVASQIDDYLFRDRAVSNDIGHEFQHGGMVFQCNHVDMMSIVNFEFTHASTLESWREAANQDLRESVDPEDVSKLQEQRAMRTSVELHADDVHMASGDVVAASPHFTSWLHTRDRNISLLEMETAGVLRSLHSRAEPIRAFAIRGVSDVSWVPKEVTDSMKKVGETRKVAMRNATRFLFCLLEEGIIPSKPR